ncbi:MAG TPA: hypothetical protein VFC44_13580 [Candidatus Saccharimonadales bacterium]|nr:hypothetical protein [Candidatus Saccharimonadales bacterium]
MSPRHSNSLTSLALVVGVSLWWVAVPVARAGDKIDFSAPTVPLGVPQLERENKEASAPGHATSLLDSGPSFEVSELPPVTETVIITAAPKKKADRSWETDSLGNRNSTGDQESTDNDPYATPQRLTGMTNRMDMQRGWSPAPENLFPQRRAEEGEGNQTFRERMDSLSMSGSRDSLNRDRFDGSSKSFESDSAWASGSFSHAFPSLDRMRAGQFVDPQAKTILDSLPANAAPASNPDDPHYGYATAPGMTEYTSQTDALRGKAPEETMSALPVYRSTDTRYRANQTYNNPGDSTSDFSPESRGMAPSRPAVLQFPKKPGDVLR